MFDVCLDVRVCVRVCVCVCVRVCVASDLAVQLNMLDVSEKDEVGLPLTVRKVFLIGLDKKLKVELTYPAMYAGLVWCWFVSVVAHDERAVVRSIGRNFEEIQRIVIAMQLVATGPVSTPCNWAPGKVRA